jgi:hypothetical protein
LLGFAFRFPDLPVSVRLVLRQRNDLTHGRTPRRTSDGAHGLCPTYKYAPCGEQIALGRGPAGNRRVRMCGSPQQT